MRGGEPRETITTMAELEAVTPPTNGATPERPPA